MVESKDRSILLIGESNAGKTHYGAQFLRRLIVGDNALTMDGAASNLRPFSAALDCLAEGRSTEHTPATTYVESIWPLKDRSGHKAQLVWPDYAGEQVLNLVKQRKVPTAWRDRVMLASDWVLLLRLHSVRAADDLFSRPLDELGKPSPERKPYEPSDQARTIELLQILLYVAGVALDRACVCPGLTVLLSCWDELNTDEAPSAVLIKRLPMLAAFIESNWVTPTVMGLSALEKPLSTKETDTAYATQGPESFGYVILPDGTRSNDITRPIQHMLAAAN